jgi:AcrR family transcriptional regulator
MLYVNKNMDNPQEDNMDNPQEDSAPINRGRGRPRKHSREALIDMAIELLDKVGFGGLTLHALARRAGVIAPTLYNSFDSVDDLHMAVLSKLIPVNKLDLSMPLRAQLIDTLISYRVALARHPHVLHPVIGSEGWVKVTVSLNSWLEALAPLPQSSESMLSALYALFGVASISAAREREWVRICAFESYSALNSQSILALPPESSSVLRSIDNLVDPGKDQVAWLKDWLNDLIDRLLPGIDELSPVP